MKKFLVLFVALIAFNLSMDCSFKTDLQSLVTKSKNVVKFVGWTGASVYFAKQAGVPISQCLVDASKIAICGGAATAAYETAPQAWKDFKAIFR